MPKQYLKYLKKLSKPQREKLGTALDLIEKSKFETLDISRLKGFKSLFRCRVGKFRIVFEKSDNKNSIIEIETRGDIY